MDYDPKLDETYLSDITDRVKKDLEESPVLADNIQQQLKPDIGQSLIEHLVEVFKKKDIVTFIQSIESAFRDTLDSLGGNSAREAAGIRNTARALLPKLIVFNIYEQWMQEYLRELHLRGQTSYLPDLGSESIEVVMARKLRVTPSLERRTQRIQGGLESGIGTECKVDDIIQQIYDKVFKNESPKDSHGKYPSQKKMTDRNIRLLRARMRQDQGDKDFRSKRNYTWIIPAHDKVDSEVQQQVAEIIPELQWVILRSGNEEQVFMTDDIELTAAIQRFFETIDRYKS